MILLGLIYVNSTLSCAGLEQFRTSIDEAVAGDNAVISVPKTNIVERGMVMCKPGAYAAYTKFDAEVRTVVTTSQHQRVAFKV